MIFEVFWSAVFLQFKGAINGMFRHEWGYLRDCFAVFGADLLVIFHGNGGVVSGTVLRCFRADLLVVCHDNGWAISGTVLLCFGASFLVVCHGNEGRFVMLWA